MFERHSLHTNTRHLAIITPRLAAPMPTLPTLRLAIPPRGLVHRQLRHGRGVQWSACSVLPQGYSALGTPPDVG
ncbi:hypothetical protein E2C01_002624 [Portunus trituberculatus]|uniref:Uncharacterized protein n=1 Tax=Portunus trituberculatus TaxID=210409 RepID=A0A5B7CLQ7_PORTR|nr:hypothetical protein [Portunus trituberculatus]